MKTLTPDGNLALLQLLCECYLVGLFLKRSSTPASLRCQYEIYMAKQSTGNVL